MKAAEKEVEQLERKYREDNGLPTEPEQSGELAPVQLPKHRVLLRQKLQKERFEAEQHQEELKKKVDDLSSQISNLQKRLKELNDGATVPRVVPDKGDNVPHIEEEVDNHRSGSRNENNPTKENEDGAIVQGEFVEFPKYDGSEPPVEWKKPFTQFCIRTRKEVKNSLPLDNRKDKGILNGMLKDRWTKLSEDNKAVWREWTEWDKQRFARELLIFDRLKNQDDMKAVHVPKKRKGSPDSSNFSIPKRKKL
jgi:chaperonin cofactor prefoldin